MALVDLSSQTAPYISDTGTATNGYTEQRLAVGTRTVTVRLSGAGVWGYHTGRGYPLDANVGIEIPVAGRPDEPGAPTITSIWIKGDAGGETVYLDCSPFRR